MKSHPNPNRNLQSSADMIQASTDESDDDLPIISIKPAAAAVDHPGPMSDPPSKNKSQNSSSIRKWWLSLVYLLTFCIPSLCLRRCFRNLQTEIAWREKIVWNILIFILSFMFLFLVIGVGWIVCPQRNVVMNDYELGQLSKLSYPLVQIYGYSYLIKDVFSNHVTQAAYLNSGAFETTVLSKDVSPMFVKPNLFEKYCPGLPKPPRGWDNIKRDIPEVAITTWVIHDSKNEKGSFKDYLGMISKDRKAPMARDQNWIKRFLLDDPVSNYILVVYGKVYDVSQYQNTIQKPTFLGPNIAQIISKVGQSGQDASTFFDQVKQKEGDQKFKAYMNCMDEMFFVGVVDERNSLGCQATSLIVLVASLLIVAIIGIKFLAALQTAQNHNPEPPERFVLIAVPCYNESFESLKNTFESVAATKYSNVHKLLFVIVDGVVKGKENDQFTSDIVLSVLGYQTDSGLDSGTAALPRMYSSLGDGSQTINFAKVYSGLYTMESAQIPYIVVVKSGDLGNNGNRGKRDSQLVLMDFLSRIHLEKPLCPLDLELQYVFVKKIGLDSRVYEFLHWVDGDTTVDAQSLALFVSCMENDSLISGITGETELRNPSESWVTMIQVFDYFISFNLSKAFESLLNSVTCLPGCFSLYRIFSATDGVLVLVSERLIADYGVRNANTLHMKNLLALGEDRYLSTLILKQFPNMKTKYISNAVALTSAPAQFGVLLSQRRRWINSTIHNLLELLFLKELPGFFIFSIRFLVLVEFISTLLSPVGFIYFIYLFVVLFSQVNVTIPLVSILLLCSLYGLQVLLFLIKLKFAHIGWMFLYLLAMPLYTFILPLYSFWKMDDFSWGQTRQVQADEQLAFPFDLSGGGDVENDAQQQYDQEQKDQAVVMPLKTWSEYERDGSLALRIDRDRPQTLFEMDNGLPLVDPTSLTLTKEQQQD